MNEDVLATKPKKERSPNFPFISLKKAVERAEALHANHKKEAARLVAIAPTWGYGAKSSGLMQTVAALKQFGLIEDSGSGDDRKVQVSDLARRIIVDQRPGMREEAIKEAARKPRLIAEYAEKWVPDRPSEAHCISELELDRGFSSDAARAFIRIFDETIAFAKLDEDALNGAGFISETLGSDEEHPAVGQSRRAMELDYVAPSQFPRGPRAFSDRLKVAMDGRTLAVTATLESESEADQLIAMLNATKGLLPKSLRPEPPSTGGAGALNLD